MPSPGPWQDNNWIGHRDHQLVTDVYWQFTYTVSNADRAIAMADTSTSPAHSQLPDPTSVTFTPLLGGAGATISHALFEIDAHGLADQLIGGSSGNRYPPQIDPSTPTPPGVIDVEFEANDGTFAADLSMTVTVAANNPTGSVAGAVHTYHLRRLLPGDYHADRATGLATYTKVPSDSLALRPLLGSHTETTGAAYVPIVGTVLGTDADAGGYLGLIVHDDQELAGLPPADVQSIGGILVTLLVPYRNPRFRWIYAVPPPQRQFPRDDGLAISTRRSWPPPTSTQYSQRRGPNATYQ